VVKRIENEWQCQLNLLEATWNSYRKVLGKEREIDWKGTREGRKTRRLMYEESLRRAQE